LKKPGTVEAANEREQLDWTIERNGFDEFRATPEVPNGEEAAAIVFKRDGFGWRLTKIDLPEGGLGKSE